MMLSPDSATLANHSDAFDWKGWVALAMSLTVAAGTWWQNNKQTERKGEIDTRLKSHEKALDRLGDRIKAEEQRDYYNYSLYIAKRHTAYARLYELISTLLFRLVASHNSILRPAEFSQMNQKALIGFLQENKWQDVEELPIIRDWPNLAAENAQRHMAKLFESDAALKYAIASEKTQSYLLAKSLYLTPRVDEAANALLNIMNQLVGSRFSADMTHLHEQIEHDLFHLRDIMRDDLSNSRTIPTAKPT